MAYGRANLHELRVISRSTTFTTSFTAGNHTDWTNATKLRVHDLSVDGLEYSSEKDKSIQQRFHGKPANIDTVKKGTLKFKMYLEGGSSTTDAPATASVMSYCAGTALKSPSAISDAAEADSAAWSINATGHGLSAGQAVLVGTKGDGKGDGKVAVVETVDSADQYTFHSALPGTPAESDVVKHGHTIYLDPMVEENYCDFFLINHYGGSGATDYPDQLNLIGCAGKWSVGGTKPGEHPYVEFEFQIGDWRDEPYSTRATMVKTTAGSGGDPAGDQGVLNMVVCDASSYARIAVSGGDFSANPNLVVESIPGNDGNNGRSGWINVPSEDGVTCEVTRYFGDMPGLYDDFVNGTAKYLLFQWGHTAQHTVAMELQRAFLDSIPERIEFSKISGLKLKFHGDSGQSTDESTADYRLQDSPLRLHFL